MSSTFLTSTSLALPDIYRCSIIRHDLVTTGLAHPLLKALVIIAHKVRRSYHWRLYHHGNSLQGQYLERSTR